MNSKKVKDMEKELGVLPQRVEYSFIILN